MGNTTIQWTEKTWNPTRGCTKISPGCKHCYAETFSNRFVGVKGNAYELGFKPRTAPHKLSEPLSWTEPSVVFVNSMSDLFEKTFTEPYIRRVWGVMDSADWHVYQVLTKRAARLREFMNARHPRSWVGQPQHIWLGVSVENRKHGLPRIEHLRNTPAAVRFLSVEPLLEDLGELNLDGIDWVIVGGESGPGARPMLPEWVVNVQRQCEDQNTRFFFKQWGGTRKKKNGRLLYERTWDDMPPIVRARYPGRAVAKARRESLGL